MHLGTELWFERLISRKQLLIQNAFTIPHSTDHHLIRIQAELQNSFRWLIGTPFIPYFFLKQKYFSSFSQIGCVLCFYQRMAGGKNFHRFIPLYREASRHSDLSIQAFSNPCKAYLLYMEYICNVPCCLTLIIISSAFWVGYHPWLQSYWKVLRPPDQKFNFWIERTTYGQIS